MSYPNLQSPRDERGGAGLRIRAVQMCEIPLVEADSDEVSGLGDQEHGHLRSRKGSVFLGASEGA